MKLLFLHDAWRLVDEDLEQVERFRREVNVRGAAVQVPPCEVEREESKCTTKRSPW